MDINKDESVKDKITIEPAEIDLDVLDILGKECAITAINSETDMRRLELNCLCEMLSQFKKYQISLDETLNILMLVGNEKIVDFFTKMRENIADEEKIAAETN